MRPRVVGQDHVPCAVFQRVLEIADFVHTMTLELHPGALQFARQELRIVGRVFDEQDFQHSSATCSPRSTIPSSSVAAARSERASKGRAGGWPLRIVRNRPASEYTSSRRANTPQACHDLPWMR